MPARDVPDGGNHDRDREAVRERDSDQRRVADPAAAMIDPAPTKMSVNAPMNSATP